MRSRAPFLLREIFAWCLLYHQALDLVILVDPLTLPIVVVFLLLQLSWGISRLELGRAIAMLREERGGGVSDII